MKFPRDVLIESVCIGKSNEEYGIEFVFESDWKNDYRYQYRYIVFKHEGNFYKLVNSRRITPDEFIYDSDDWDEEVECEQINYMEVDKNEKF